MKVLLIRPHLNPAEELQEILEQHVRQQSLTPSSSNTPNEGMCFRRVSHTWRVCDSCSI